MSISFGLQHADHFLSALAYCAFHSCLRAILFPLSFSTCAYAYISYTLQTSVSGSQLTSGRQPVKRLMLVFFVCHLSSLSVTVAIKSAKWRGSLEGTEAKKFHDTIVIFIWHTKRLLVELCYSAQTRRAVNIMPPKNLVLYWPFVRRSGFGTHIFFDKHKQYINLYYKLHKQLAYLWYINIWVLKIAYYCID